MSKKFGLMSLESVESQYLDGRNVLTVSEQTGSELDKEVSSIISECYQRALSLLKDYRQKMDEIAECLFEKEIILGEEFMEILKNEVFM